MTPSQLREMAEKLVRSDTWINQDKKLDYLKVVNSNVFEWRKLEDMIESALRQVHDEAIEKAAKLADECNVDITGPSKIAEAIRALKLSAKETK